MQTGENSDLFVELALIKMRKPAQCGAVPDQYRANFNKPYPAFGMATYHP